MEAGASDAGNLLHCPDQRTRQRVADREEKGSDVNVATRLLTDVFEQKIDAAVVISNDSDLALPVKHARARVPVGDRASRYQLPRWRAQWSPRRWRGGHWWRQLAKFDYVAHQLPHPTGLYRRPAGW